MIAERYPELYFRLMWEGAGECKTEALYAKDGIEAELERFQKSLHLDQIEVLYLYGLGLGHHFAAVEEWLKGDLGRKLVIFEDDLAVVDASLRFGRGEEVLSHPQVYLRYVAGPKHWHFILRECAKEFPTSRLDLTAIESYKTKKRIPSLRLKLLRLSGLVETYFSEAIHAHIIHANLFKNVNHLVDSFDAGGLRGAFKGIPAILCGAGPSLKEAIGTLKTLQDRALILAGGSTITALGNLGVTPHLALAIDPNEEEYSRLKASVVQEIPFLYGPRLHPKVFQAFNGPLGYVRTMTGGSGEKWITKQLDIEGESIGEELGPEALSITTLGLAVAFAMGCDPIVMVGVDLAFTGLERYAPGIMSQQKIDPKTITVPRQQLETMLKRKNIEGETIYTLVKWIMEAEVFGRFAKTHRRCRFINSSKKGLPMRGIPFVSLEQIAQEHCKKQRDLLGRLHQITQELKFEGITKTQISSEMTQLKESLKRVAEICQEMLVEIETTFKREELPLFQTGKMVALEMQFEEEIAFEALFESASHAFAMKKQNGNALNPLALAKEKWEYFFSVTNRYLGYFPTR